VKFRALGLLIMTIANNSAAGAYLGEITWREAEAQLPVRLVIIPFAAGAKEHGEHLPLGTDQIVMRALLDAAVAERDVLVAPPILHGWFPGFREYPGTEISDATVFQQYVAEVARSLVRHGATRLVFLNTGISKASGLPLSIVARDIRADHNVPTLVVSWDDLESEDAASLYEQEKGGHADEGETSILLYLRSDLVHMDRAGRDYRGPSREQIGYAPGKFDRATEPGLFGDATLATVEKGEQLFAIMRRNWLEALDQFAARR
jgi:creatinine amidohydrolase